MINHLIWAAGLIEHLILLAVLFKRRRVARFPWFTLLIIFYVVRSVGLVAALRFSGHPAPQFLSMIIDLTDVLLQCAVLAELSWNSLQPLGGIRRFTVPLLLLASGVLIVLRLAPSGHSSLRTILVLMHFLLSVLMVEWAIVLAFCFVLFGFRGAATLPPLALGSVCTPQPCWRAAGISLEAVRCRIMFSFRSFGFLFTC